MRGKRDQRRGGTQRESEVHDAQAAGVESFDELEKDFRHGGLQKQRRVLRRMGSYESMEGLRSFGRKKRGLRMTPHCERAGKKAISVAWR